MQTHTTLATRFAQGATTLRRDTPLSELDMRAVAPSIFAVGKHVSRSDRYTYIPTIDVLRSLRREGFEPFMVAQGRSRVPGKSEFTKHMIRMRHAGSAPGRTEASEIVLINSHDGASSYQMLHGVLRFICLNGMVVGDIASNIRIPHKGNVQGDVIDAAYRVLDDVAVVAESTGRMKSRQLREGEERAFATAALALRYGSNHDAPASAPITAEQLLEPRRKADTGHDLWSTFQRVQENMMRGGQAGRSTQGRRMQTRPIGSIDRSVDLNRALWVLAEEMRKIQH